MHDPTHEAVHRLTLPLTCVSSSAVCGDGGLSFAGVLTHALESRGTPARAVTPRR
jgi:hypothetical protein